MGVLLALYNFKTSQFGSYCVYYNTYRGIANENDWSVRFMISFQMPLQRRSRRPTTIA